HGYWSGNHPEQHRSARPTQAFPGVDLTHVRSRTYKPNVISTVALDLGKPSCRAAVFTGAQRGTTVTVPGSGGLAEPDGVPSAAEAVATAVKRTGVTTVERISLALAGFGRTTSPDPALVQAVASAVWRRVAEETGNPESKGEDLADGEILLCSDIVAAHVGALAGAPGVVQIAGTGAA